MENIDAVAVPGARRRRVWVVAMVLVGLAALGVGEVAPRGAAVLADPRPGCGSDTGPWYDPCAANPPVPGRNNWLPIDGVPGSYGPHGYTPITPNLELPPTLRSPLDR